MQSSTYRGEKTEGVEAAMHKVFRYHERTPKQPRNSESASRYILPHLHESIAQTPDGDSLEQGVGLQQAQINARHYRRAERDPQTRAQAAVPPSPSADRQPAAGLGETEDVGWR